MKRDQKKAAVDTQDLLSYNEERANHYTAVCLLISAGVAALMWALNIAGFFIVDKTLMNIAMPAGMVFLITPYILMKCTRIKSGALKYLMICCFLVGVCVMSSVLTIQLVLAWACPIVISCHYYSPKFTGFTLAGVLACMLLSVYAGLYFGVWDSNMMRSSAELYGAGLRREFIRAAAQAGDNILLRVFNFYYIPRAAICTVVYLIGMTLSKRTHGLLVRQNEITQEKERIDTELNVAKQIQTSLLPCIFPAFPENREFEIHASMDPAKEVGGDFYDFFMPDEDHLAVVIADVSGKGVPAALFMVIAKTLLKDHTGADSDPGTVFTEVNRLLCESNSEGLFVTAFEGVLDLRTGELRYVNAGHEPPYVSYGGCPFEQYTAYPGFVLAGMENTQYKTGVLQLHPGDALFLYTDGVTEATDARNELYGKGRLQRVLSENSGGSPKEMIAAAYAGVSTFVGDTPQFDDITMLALKIKNLKKE